MSNTELKQLSIDHYNRMITYAKTLKPTNLITKNLSFGMNLSSIMMEDIKETWYGDWCSYCQRYGNKCSKCELGELNEEFDFGINSGITEMEFDDQDVYKCCDGLWDKMSRSLTIEQWIERAEDVKKYIIENG